MTKPQQSQSISLTEIKLKTENIKIKSNSK